MLWITNPEKCSIPDSLKYPNYQTDKNSRGQTPLMLWINYHPDEDIPEQLFYDSWNTDKDNGGRTPYMLWNKKHPNERPYNMFVHKE